MRFSVRHSLESINSHIAAPPNQLHLLIRHNISLRNNLPNKEDQALADMRCLLNTQENLH